MFTGSREDVKTMDLEAAAADIIDASCRLHRDLGPGLFDRVYEAVLAATLQKLGYEVQRQMPVPFTFEELSFDAAFWCDLVIGGRPIVEIKSVERVDAALAEQLLTYLRLTQQTLGLLINFGGATLKEGLPR